MSDVETAFFLESGSLALDFLNTGTASDEALAEQLGGPRELIAWMGATALRPAVPADPTEIRILLTEAHRLRDHIAGLVTAFARDESPPAHAVYGLNRVLASSLTSVSVRVDREGAHLVPEERGETLLTILGPVARAAADLLVSSEPSRIRRCASGTCERWFVDTSKGGRRKWCSMATCGNRAKAESHRRRHAGA